MTDPEPHQRPQNGDEGRPQSLLRPFVDDSALWPVLAVMILVAATLGASMVVLALQDGNLAALAGLVVLAALTLFALEPDLRHRRLGLEGRLALTVWAMSLGAGLAFVRLVST